MEKALEQLSYVQRVFFGRGIELVIAKFLAAEAKHGWNGKWRVADQKEVQKAFYEHINKGDPRDIIIYCLIMLWHGWTIKTPTQLKGMR